MALVLHNPYFLPPHPNNVSTTPTFSGTQLVIAASTNDVSIVFDAPKTGNVSKVHFRTGTVTSGTTVLDCRLETRNSATGYGSGTLVGTNTNGDSASIGSADDNVMVSATLTAAAALTRGTSYVLKLDVKSGTPSNLGIGCFFDDGLLSLAYCIENTTLVQPGAPILVLEYDTGEFICPMGCLPYHLTNSYIFNDTDTPDVYANKFSLDYPAEVCGAWVWADVDGAFVMELLDSDGVTVLATATVGDANYPPSASAYILPKQFPTPVELAADTTYYLTVRPTSGTDMTLYSATAGSSDLFTAFHWNAVMTSAKNPTGTGSWTDATNEQLFCGLMVSGTDDGSGGGAGLAMGPLSGGIIQPFKL
jgi:hypothetical protein